MSKRSNLIRGGIVALAIGGAAIVSQVATADNSPKPTVTGSEQSQQTAACLKANNVQFATDGDAVMARPGASAEEVAAFSKALDVCTGNGKPGATDADQNYAREYAKSVSGCLNDKGFAAKTEEQKDGSIDLLTPGLEQGSQEFTDVYRSCEKAAADAEREARAAEPQN